MNIKECLEWGYDKLKNFDNYRNICIYILAEILNKDNVYIKVHYLDEVEEENFKRFIQSIQSFLNGKPIQYINNKAYFMGLEFYVDENVLIPRCDTEILVEEVINIIKKNNIVKVLDLCTGSGAIAISLKKYMKDIVVTASDVSNNALSVAKKNAEKIGVDIKFIESDLFNNINEKFDLIVSNPPYIKKDVIPELDIQVRNEPIIALDGGEDGLKFYKKIIKNSKKFLNKNGFLCFEIGFDQKKDVTDILMQNGYINVYSKKDYGKNDRIIVCNYNGG